MGDSTVGGAYGVFVSQLDEATMSFPSLQRVVVNGEEILKGSLSIIDKDGKHWEDYEVEIHVSEEFPYRFPRLFEVSGKIPRIADWHVYEDTGSCCVKILPEEVLRCKNGITVTEYIQEEVLPYLFNQTHRRTEGYYVNGEHSHGLRGIFEYYANILNTGDNIKLTVQLLRYIATNDRPARTAACFCGNGNKFRQCHRLAFDRIKPIGSAVLLDHAENIARAAGLA